MRIQLNNALKSRVFAALLAAGITGPSAYVAVNHTMPAEGFYTNVYDDPLGLKTYCVGHLARKGEVLKKEYTEDECIALFVNDWKAHQTQYDSIVKVPHRSEWMRAAGTDFTFHMGLQSVASSTYIRMVNAGKADEACEQLTRWVYGKVNGVMVKMPGLVLRATDRYKYCMGKIPADYQQTMQSWGK